MDEARLREIEQLHGVEPAPGWATELLAEVRRLHGRADAPGVQPCPACHRLLVVPDRANPNDVLTAHMQIHNQEPTP